MNNDDDILAWHDPRSGFLVWEQQGQLAWEFEEAGSLAKLLSQPDVTPEEVWKAVGARVDEQQERHMQWLKRIGMRIFEVQEHNDRKSIEADYGAPAKGLTFFSRILDENPARFHRYERVHVLGDDLYQTHHDQAVDIGRAQKAEGFRIFDHSGEEAYPARIHFSNGGVTKAFSDLIEDIVHHYKAQQSFRGPLGMDTPGVILVPVPTYGLFLWRMREAVRATGIQIAPVRRHDNGAVNLYSLESVLEECMLTGKRVLAYYDCNPQNPTGHIREQEETEQIYERLDRHIERYLIKSADYIKEKKEPNEEFRPHISQWVNAMSMIYSYPVLIDDMSYQGLEFDPGKKPYSFAQLSREAADRTAVLKGVSKIGMPGARIGMLMAHPGLVVPLADKQLVQEFSASSLGVDLLAARYGTHPNRTLFEEHENELRALHHERAGIIRAFFYGLDRDHTLDTSQKEKLVSAYAEHANISKSESAGRLREGLSQFHLPEEMDCGFFYRVNCENLRGKLIAINVKGTNRASYLTIQNSDTLKWVFHSFGMHVVPAHQQGCSDQTMSVRITTSLPKDQLFGFYDNMRAMQDHFFGRNPQVQLDLFRKNMFQP